MICPYTFHPKHALAEVFIVCTCILKKIARVLAKPSMVSRFALFLLFLVYQHTPMHTHIRLVMQFAKSLKLPCCQCTETCSHVSSVQNNIYTPVTGPVQWRIVPAQNFQCLTHWGRDKMNAISQTTFSNAFSWMKSFEFRLNFHWSLFLRVQSTIFQHWFR